MSINIVIENAKKDPYYAPYCLRCSTMERMGKVEPFYWRCRHCGAEADYRQMALDNPAEGGKITPSQETTHGNNS